MTAQSSTFLVRVEAAEQQYTAVDAQKKRERGHHTLNWTQCHGAPCECYLLLACPVVVQRHRNRWRSSFTTGTGLISQAVSRDV